MCLLTLLSPFIFLLKTLLTINFNKIVIAKFFIKPDLASDWIKYQLKKPSLCIQSYYLRESKKKILFVKYKILIFSYIALKNCLFIFDI